MSAKADTISRPKESPPDIFRAASNNDVAELLAALRDGQSLSQQDPRKLHFTPVHIASMKCSNDFLAAGAQHESFNPWIRDDNDRTAFDHADAHCNERGKRILFDAMYAEKFEPGVPSIDVTDNEPSEFFPGAPR